MTTTLLLGSIPGLGRSLGEGKGHPLQYSGLENSMDSTVHGTAKSRTWLSNFHFHPPPCRLPQWLSGKESFCNAGDMGSIPGSGRSPGEGNGNLLQYSCWEIPQTEEAGGL